MCVHTVINLKYDTIEMTASTNEDCIGWLLAVSWGRNETFDSERFKFYIKGDFSNGANG